MIKDGVVNLLAFGPSLVENGEITVDTNSEVGQSMASNPRTAIGIIDENHYIIVVSDGRTSESQGLSLYQLAEVMKSYGVKTAYNLDGGGIFYPLLQWPSYEQTNNKWYYLRKGGE